MKAQQARGRHCRGILHHQGRLVAAGGARKVTIIRHWDAVPPHYQACLYLAQEIQKEASYPGPSMTTFFVEGPGASLSWKRLSSDLAGQGSVLRPPGLPHRGSRHIQSSVLQALLRYRRKGVGGHLLHPQICAALGLRAPKPCNDMGVAGHQPHPTETKALTWRWQRRGGLQGGSCGKKAQT